MKKPEALTPFDRVEIARGQRGWTQAQLCHKAGLAPLGEAPPAAPVPTAAGGPHTLIAHDRLMPSPLNPRKIDLNDAEQKQALEELANSIAEKGLQQNLVVRAAAAGLYRIVAGERRWRAIGLLVNAAGWNPQAANIPCKVVEVTDAEHLQLALIENGQRRDVPPMEEAEGYAKLQKLDPKRWTAGEIARQIGMTARHVQLRLVLVNKLHPEGKKALADGHITLAHARSLVIGPMQAQYNMIADMARGAPYSPADIREHMLHDMIPLQRAVFPVKDSKLETFTDDDTGNEYFTDREGFLREQKKAVDKMVKDFGSEWKFAKVVEHFPTGAYVKALASEKAKAGCIIVLSRDGTVTVKKNVVKKAEGATAKISSKDMISTKEIEAQRAAGDGMTDAIGAAITGEDSLDGLRFFFLCVLGDYNDGVPTISMDDPGIHKDVIKNTALKTLNRFLRPGFASLLKLKGDADVGAVWAALRDIDAIALVDAFATHLSKSFAADFGEANTWLLAKAMGVKLKAEHAATWRKALAGKIPGVQLDLEDAKPAKKKAAE